MHKWTKEDGTPRKAVFHSYLVREPGLMLKLKGDVRDSKYPGKPPYVYIQVPDDDAEYALNIEPGTEQAFKDAPKGVWLRCHATGSKDTPPCVHFSDEGGPVLPAGASADEWEEVEAPPSVGKPMTGPAPNWPDDKPKASAPTTANGYHNATMARCWGDAVALVRADFPEATADAGVEAASRIANTLFIQASR